ncbi:hypothetical protein CPB85DRAFT_1346770, partial [Mucidula mucida]
MLDLDGEWEAEGSVDDYDYHEDSDLEELEEDEMNTSHSGIGHLDGEGEHPMISPRQMGRICQPKNIAYKTFKGLLVYLYTQEIILAPLKSTQITRKGKGTASDLSSPKSIGLTTDNIYPELCSKFTSLYPEVLEAELGFAVDHWAESENRE